MNRPQDRLVATRVRRRALLAAGLVLALSVAGCASGDGGTAEGTRPSATTTPATAVCAEPGLPTTVAYRTIPGVAANLTSIDVHAPAQACGAPVVIWVHGGGYQIGDKSNQIADKTRLFNDHRWVLVSVNYRLTKPGHPNSAQYPDHFDDVAAAIAWVHANIAEYGGDPSRLAVLGHSAGADIVSNVVTNPTYLRQNGVGLDAVRCAGPLDTEGFDKQSAGAGDRDADRDQWQVALGNNPDYLTATSATDLVEPGIGIPPMIGVVRGSAQRRQIETKFLDTLRAAGIAATTIDARSLSHMQVNTQIGTAGDTVMTAPLVAFLTDCFK